MARAGLQPHPSARVAWGPGPSLALSGPRAAARGASGAGGRGCGGRRLRAERARPSAARRPGSRAAPPAERSESRPGPRAARGRAVKVAGVARASVRRESLQAYLRERARWLLCGVWTLVLESSISSWGSCLARVPLGGAFPFEDPSVQLSHQHCLAEATPRGRASETFLEKGRSGTHQLLKGNVTPARGLASDQASSRYSGGRGAQELAEGHMAAQKLSHYSGPVYQRLVEEKTSAEARAAEALGLARFSVCQADASIPHLGKHLSSVSSEEHLFAPKVTDLHVVECFLL
ncbi:PREDICTED: uncharacterized protein LOC102026952 isoform X2 [Chinchilla lanigera]|uniref:uncharacterized protein LOC102026952 isoform X2 n=1 Tax=Chinchilla lanigera TaxID=34839 RepID=UPI000699026A|nr:PREDICTED: uncharacterized protein LOC102026952 isoform X2 [Chinchilla lanigera]